NHDDTVYLAKKDNKITFQILSFLNRIELIENSTPEEVKLTIDESRKKALSKKKRDLFLDSQDASAKGKEKLLRDFLAYKSFDGFSFLNRIEDFFIENESNNISFEEYYNLNNFKNDYDETKYGSKESKINNLFHKSKALSLGLDIRSNRKREDKTAFISNSMLNFAEEINQKKGLIKWNQNLINLIISVLEGTEKSEDLIAYDNLNKSPFVPEKRDQKEIIKQILKREDIDKSKVKESLYKIHFHSFLPTKQVEIRGKIQRLIKNHPTTKDLPTKSWLKEFESSLRKKDDFFEAIKKAIEKWALSSKRSIGYNNAKRERILTGEENFQTDKILILFFKKTKLDSFSEDVKANLLKKVDLNLFSYKYLPKSKIKKISRIFNNFLSQGSTYLPKEIKEINKSLNYHVNSPEKSSNDHLNELIKLKNKIKEVKKNPPAGNKEALEILQEEALQELKFFIKKFPYSPKLKTKDKKELSAFKDIFSKYHKEQNIYWNGLISQYDKDHPLYLKSKIKALENDILYEEFKIILGLEDPVTLKEKINN
ncbi:MAG: hypothetical protein VXW15_10520, partial [Bdellovibrionota bacterium]|nr:hypothetical protein [Bdellovibrionota bacterium]